MYINQHSSNAYSVQLQFRVQYSTVQFQLAQQCIQISTRINSSSVHTYIFVCFTLRVILQGFVTQNATSTTQLGKLAMFLKEAVITTLRTSHDIYEQNIKRLHNTTIAAMAIATSTMNCIDHNKMNPNNDRNSHISVNSRKPNDEYDYSYRSHPPNRSGTYSD